MFDDPQASSAGDAEAEDSAWSRLSHGTGDLQSIIDPLPIGMLLMDVTHARILTVNREAARLLASSTEHLLGRRATEVLAEPLAELCQPARWQSLVAGRRGTREEMLLDTPHGARFLQLQRTVLTQVGLRRPLGQLTLQDVGPKRQLERALRESDMRFREVTDAVRECLFVTTLEWDRLHFSSPLLPGTLGLSSHDLAKGPQIIRERVHPEDRALYDSRTEVEAAGETHDMVLRIQHPSKGLRWVRMRTRAQVQPAGQTLVYVILADVTEEQERNRELQRARDAAEAASQAKSEFMATMSHEIRTPMNGMLGMTELLLGTPLSAQQRHYAESAYHSAEGLLGLLDNVLDFARASASRLPLELSEFNPAQLVTELAHTLRPRAQAKALRLELTISAPLPERVMGDPARLRQALLLLLDNAIKFTPRGRVTLGLAGTGGAVPRLLFEVIDSGVGIAAEQLPLLFSAFTQGHGGLARQHGGAGLGLAVARQLVELLGGEIAVESQPGQGSRFHFSTPLNGVAQPSSVTKLTPTLPKNDVGPGQAILVVEDNAVNQEVIQEILLQLGYRVDLRDDALTGLQALCERRYDLVLMDIHMPGMDGMEALTLFRRGSNERFTFVTPVSTPVVAVTANALDGDERRLLQHGFDDYLSKPLWRQHLIEMLARRLPAVSVAPNEHDKAQAMHEPQAAPAQASAAPAPSAAAASARPVVLDEPSLQRLRALDPSGKSQLITRVVNAYLGSLDRLLPDLAPGPGGERDAAAIRHVAHTLKSSSASLGALDVSRRCAEIELLARNGQSEGMDALLDSLLSEIEGTKIALTALLTATE